MTMRFIAVIATVFACAGTLSACQWNPDYFVLNESGQEIRLVRDQGAVNQNEHALAPGERARLMVHPYVVRAGECFYSYPDLPVAKLFEIRKSRGEKIQKPFELRLQADFTLRLFSAEEGGQFVEVADPLLPARPQVDCRTKG